MKRHVLIMALMLSACAPAIDNGAAVGPLALSPSPVSPSPSVLPTDRAPAVSPSAGAAVSPSPSPWPSPSPTATPTPSPRLFEQRSGVKANLHAVQFLDAETGYVVGENGTVLKTTDAGAHWTSVGEGIDDGRDITGLSFMDADTGWVVSGQGVFHTADGGQTWLRESDAYGAVGGDVKFVDADHGYVSGVHGLFETQDGGTTWEAHDEAPPLFSLQIQGDTIFGLTNGKVHRYTPGLGWTVVHTFESLGYGRERLCFISDQEGWLHTADALYWTTDSGETWTQVAAPEDGESLSVTFLNRKVGWLRYAAGTINSDSFYRTLDGGSTWEQVTTPFNAMINAFTFVDEETGWLVGFGGKVWRYAVQ